HVERRNEDEVAAVRCGRHVQRAGRPSVGVKPGEDVVHHIEVAGSTVGGDLEGQGLQVLRDGRHPRLRYVRAIDVDARRGQQVVDVVVVGARDRIGVRDQRDRRGRGGGAGGVGGAAAGGGPGGRGGGGKNSAPCPARGG